MDDIRADGVWSGILIRGECSADVADGFDWVRSQVSDLGSDGRDANGNVQMQPITKGIMNHVFERIICPMCRLVARPKRIVKRIAAGIEGE